jgi:hypothetical protein
MTDDSKHAILGQWAGSLRLLARVRKPVMGAVMLYVRWVNQGDQDIVVE